MPVAAALSSSMCSRTSNATTRSRLPAATGSRVASPRSIGSPRSAATCAPSSPYSIAPTCQPRPCSTRVLPPPAAPTSTATPGVRPATARRSRLRRSRYHQWRSSSSVSLRTSMPSMAFLRRSVAAAAPSAGVSATDPAVAGPHPPGGGQLREAHGTAGVQLLGGDADLGAQAELGAVGPAGRGVDDDDRGVDLRDEAVRGPDVERADRLGVAAAPAPDVRERLVERVD